MISRIVAIDDGYFPVTRHGRTTIAGLLWMHPNIRTIIDLVNIDGVDATSKAIEIMSYLESCKENTVVLLDGIAYAGFNFIDPEKVNKTCHSDFIVVFYRPLNIDKIKKALEKNFEDWTTRYSVFYKAYQNTKIVLTVKGKTHVYTNLGLSEVQKIISSTQIYSSIPEPLRLAHLIASESSLFLRRKKVIL